MFLNHENSDKNNEYFHVNKHSNNQFSGNCMMKRCPTFCSSFLAFVVFSFLVSTLCYGWSQPKQEDRIILNFTSTEELYIGCPQGECDLQIDTSTQDSSPQDTSAQVTKLTDDQGYRVAFSGSENYQLTIKTTGASLGITDPAGHTHIKMDKKPDHGVLVYVPSAYGQEGSSTDEDSQCLSSGQLLWLTLEEVNKEKSCRRTDEAPLVVISLAGKSQKSTDFPMTETLSGYSSDGQVFPGDKPGRGRPGLSGESVLPFFNQLDHVKALSDEAPNNPSLSKLFGSLETPIKQANSGHFEVIQVSVYYAFDSRLPMTRENREFMECILSSIELDDLVALFNEVRNTSISKEDFEKIYVNNNSVKAIDLFFALSDEQEYEVKVQEWAQANSPSMLEKFVEMISKQDKRKTGIYKLQIAGAVLYAIQDVVSEIADQWEALSVKILLNDGHRRRVESEIRNILFRGRCNSVAMANLISEYARNQVEDPIGYLIRALEEMGENRLVKKLKTALEATQK